MNLTSELGTGRKYSHDEPFASRSDEDDDENVFLTAKDEDDDEDGDDLTTTK